MVSCACSPTAASQEVTHHRGSAIVACTLCGLGMTDPPPAEIPYEEEDFHLSTIKPPSVEPKWKTAYYQWSYRVSLRLIRRALPAGGKVMDIGCGEGIFLRLLRDAGYETIGLEPSRTAVKRAQESGLDVRHGRLEGDQTYEPVDLVIMSHVLEHIRDFPEALRKVSEIAPGGYLLLVQTNYRGWVPRLYPQRWYAWVVNQHYWHFTPHAVSGFAAKYGYQPVACEYTSIVHEKRKLRLIAQAARLVPGAGDQFHLLLKHTAPP